MKIEGIVVHGRALGRTIGFPTANVQTEKREGDGPDGVYAAWFSFGERRLPCMVNIGHHPTLPGGGRSVEAHIFNCSEDLYGLRVCVETMAFLRGEVKFPSAEALRRQLEQDRQRALEILNMQTPPGIE